MPRTFAPDAVPPDEALARLTEGNRRFVNGQGSALRRWHPGLVEGQWPFAVVLGCADSRTPAEYVFDQGLGDLFVIRVAGNIVAPSLVGSIEFAASEFGTRLVVVMGHTHCGAVRATLRALGRGGGPASRNQRSIVDRIAPHVEHLAGEAFDLGSGAPDESHMVEAVRANVLASAQELPKSSTLLRDLVEKERVAIAAAVYDLATGVVTFMP